MIWLYIRSFAHLRTIAKLFQCVLVNGHFAGCSNYETIVFMPTRHYSGDVGLYLSQCLARLTLSHVNNVSSCAMLPHAAYDIS